MALNGYYISWRCLKKKYIYIYILGKNRSESSYSLYLRNDETLKKNGFFPHIQCGMFPHNILVQLIFLYTIYRACSICWQKSIIYWAHRNPFFHKKVKSGRQVLKSSQNPFFLILSDKNTFQRKLNHLGQVGALMGWVADKNLAYQFFFFFFFTIIAIHGSLKPSREQGERKLANSQNTSLRASVIWYFIFAKVDNHRRCNKIKSNRSDNIIIQLSTKFFLNYRHHNAYHEIQTKFYYQNTR